MRRLRKVLSPFRLLIVMTLLAGVALVAVHHPTTGSPDTVLQGASTDTAADSVPPSATSVPPSPTATAAPLPTAPPAGTRTPVPNAGMALTPVTTNIPDGVQAWSYSYPTKDASGTDVTGTAVLLVSTSAPVGPLPVILWGHGTSGIAQGCTSAYFTGAMTKSLLDQGWAVIAPDYVGLVDPGSTSYMIGGPSATDMLDAVTSIQAQLPDLLSTNVVAVGGSQGGYNTLWVADSAKNIAPGLNLEGAVALAPVTDVAAWVKGLDGSDASTQLVAYVFGAYSAVYLDVTYDKYVRGTEQTSLWDLSHKCTSDYSVINYLDGRLRNDAAFTSAFAKGAWADRMKENTPSGATNGVPVMVIQGTADTIVHPETTRAWVKAQCDAGDQIAYFEAPEMDHYTLGEQADVVRAVTAWAADRFAGVAVDTSQSCQVS